MSLNLTEGQQCKILLSPCCGATTKGVEYGDHCACRSCYETNLDWVEFLAPYSESNTITLNDGRKIEVGAGPNYDKRRPLTECDSKEIESAFFWG